MSRGRKQPLVEAILVGSFRPDRQGRLLLEETLPEECPLENGSPAGARAWRDLVTAQRGYQDTGAVNPWAFAALVRAFHAAQRTSTTADSHDRWLALSALWIGPTRGHPDEALVEHWNTWASNAEEWADHPDTYANWRFVKGLSAEKAEAKLEKIRAEEHEKWILERIDEQNIKDWHPFFGHGTPLSERRRLIRKAGRPDLIDPVTCARFGITEDTWPSEVYYRFGTRPADRK